MAQAEEEDDLENVLNCTICLDIYNDPYILKCLHTVCKKCLDSLIKHSSTGSNATCPVCRCVSHKKDTKKDFNKQTLLDIYSNSKKKLAKVEAVLPQKQAKPLDKNICEICRDGVIVCGCMECVKLMCDKCKTAHPSIPACKSHVIQPIDAIVKPFKDQLHASASLINQVGRHLLTKESEIKQHKDKVQDQHFDLTKQIVETEMAFIGKTKEYFNSLKTIANSHFKNESNDAEFKCAHLKKAINHMHSRNKEIEKVVHENDYSKIVYHSKTACNTMQGEIEQLFVDIQKINPNQLPLYYVKCHAVPEFDDFVEHNLMPKPAKTVNPKPVQKSASQAASPSFQVAQYSSSIGQRRPKAKARSPIKPKVVESGAFNDIQQHLVKDTDFSEYESCSLQKEKNIVVNSPTDPYFKITVIEKEIWCTLSDRIEIYNLDGVYMRTLCNEEIGNPYAVAFSPKTRTTFVSSNNGLFVLDDNDEIADVISKDKFVDLTWTQGNVNVICGIDMWKHRVVAFEHRKNKWCQAGEISMEGEISDLQDRIIGNVEFIYVSSMSKSTIFKHKTSGQMVGKLERNKLRVCAIDSKGQILVTNEGKGCVSIMYDTANLTAVNLDEKKLSPVCCATDYKEALWVLSKGIPFRLLKFVKSNENNDEDVERSPLSKDEKDKFLKAITH